MSNDSGGGGQPGPFGRKDRYAPAAATLSSQPSGLAWSRRAATRLVGVLVVGFDTATPAVSVALHDGERVVAQASAADGRRHGELLTKMSEHSLCRTLPGFISRAASDSSSVNNYR